MVGGGEDRLGRAVVLLEEDRRRLGEILLEILDVADGRPAEGVDRLVGVPHDRQAGADGVLPRAGEQADERVLRVVGVLVFVDEDVLEAPPVVLGETGVVPQKGDRLHDEVVEVHGVGLAQPPLVDRVRLGRDSLLRLMGRLYRGCGRDELVLHVGHAPGDPLGRMGAGVDLLLAAHHGHEAPGVGGVVDGESRAHAERRVLGAQDAHAGRVEGRNPHGAGNPSEHRLQALAHLPGGLVGEGDGQDLPGVGAPGRDEVGDAARQDPGLARTGPGYDEQRAAFVDDRLVLLGVEAAEDPLGPGVAGVAHRRLGSRACAIPAGALRPPAPGVPRGALPDSGAKPLHRRLIGGIRLIGREVLGTHRPPAYARGRRSRRRPHRPADGPRSDRRPHSSEPTRSPGRGAGCPAVGSDVRFYQTFVRKDLHGGL